MQSKKNLIQFVVFVSLFLLLFETYHFPSEFLTKIHNTLLNFVCYFPRENCEISKSSLREFSKKNVSKQQLRLRFQKRKLAEVFNGLKK